MKKQNNIKFNWGLWLAIIAIIISIINSYFQFFYVRKELYITPIKPSGVASFGETVAYKYIISNPGMSPVMLVNSYYNLEHKNLTVVMKDPDKASIQILSNTTYEQIINIKKEDLDNISSMDLNVYFDFVDAEGEYTQIILPFCNIGEQHSNKKVKNPKTDDKIKEVTTFLKPVDNCFQRIRII